MRVARALADLRFLDLSWNRLTGLLPGNWSSRVGARIYVDHNLISVRGWPVCMHLCVRMQGLWQTWAAHWEPKHHPY